MSNMSVHFSRQSWLLLLSAVGALAGCRIDRVPEGDRRSSKDAVGALPDTVRDIHSFARPSEARVTNVDLVLAADFQAKRLSGTAALAVEGASGAREIVLDTRDLTITAVTDRSGTPLRYTLGPLDSIRGQPLTVALPGTPITIVVHYQTSPDAAALQWLSPAQTAGKQLPYLFSQGQAILTRTWIPTQDSPGIRQTYTARITVPKGLRAVMSAEMMTPDGISREDSTLFTFRMRHPIPPYLIALAVGDIAFRRLGDRTGVYAEPAVLDAAAYELADMERMMQAAEALYGPYRWERYDVLVLPPSFPFGGMENPRLTFATPTILAGDRSLVSLIAHELAHSWSGNLVTNATWSDFWLNEGFTSYIELRIMERLYGRERAAMLEQLARSGLEETLRGFGSDTAGSVLHASLAGRNPDDAMGPVAYDKGAAFLRMIETTVGRARFDEYLRGYFDRHAFQSMTAARFLADLREHLVKGDEDLERRLRLDEWVYGSGLPDNAPVPRSDAFARVEAQAAAFAQGTPASALRTNGWSTQEWQHFLQMLPDTMPQPRLAELDQAYGFTRTGNSEVLFDWLRIAIRNRYEPAFPALERFLLSQGRRKFLRPLYEDLMGTSWGADLARSIYRRARPLYHSVSTGTLDQVVRGEN
ncbi:MAG TPA: M1 family metallopeptidase [Gemmatimonadaceae bacterium]|nr:M1 family metallopeptidase [Gemmatimonadaceae bacterium]